MPKVVNQTTDDEGDDDAATYPVSPARMQQFDANSRTAGAGGVPAVPATAGAAPTGGLNALAAGQFSGPYQILYQQMQAKADAQRAAQQQMMDTLQQQQGALGQTGMSDYDKASMLFQAAGALGQTTRSGGFGETLGNLGTAMAGPLSKAAEAQRQRQTQLQQLQMARQKLAVDMAGSGVDPAQALQLLQAQQKREDDETESFEPKLIAPGKYALVGDAGTIKPIPAELFGRQGAPDQSSLTGEDYLKTIDPTRANQVRSIVAGNTALPKPGTGPYKYLEQTGVLDDVARAVGNDQNEFNAITAGTVADTAKSWGSGGKNSALITSLARTMNHLDQLQTDFAKTPNISAGPLTGPANIAANALEQTSGTAVRNAKQQIKVVADELAGYFKNAVGGSASPAKEQINQMIDTFPITGNADQKQAAIDEMRKAVMGQAESLVEKYRADGGVKAKGFANAEDYIRKVFPTSAQSIDRMDNNPIPGSQRYIQLQQQKIRDAALAKQQGQQPGQIPTQPPAPPPAASAPAQQGRVVNWGDLR